MEGKITALKVQARNKQKVNVFLDGRYAFSLALIEAARLRLGQDLSEADIARLQTDNELELAHERALRFLSYRPRTEAELRRHLQKRTEDATAIEEVITRLRGSGLADDEAFGKFWVENRATFRPKARRALKAELRQKGLTAEQAEAVLDESHGGDEEAAYQAATARARRLASLPREEFFQKLAGFLARRGFSYGVVEPTVKRVWAEVAEPRTDTDLNLESEE